MFGGSLLAPKPSGIVFYLRSNLHFLLLPSWEEKQHHRVSAVSAFGLCCALLFLSEVSHCKSMFTMTFGVILFVYNMIRHDTISLKIILKKGLKK